MSVALFSLLTAIIGGDGTFLFFRAFLVTMASMVGRFLLHRQPSYRIKMHPSSDIDMTSFYDGLPLPSPPVSIKDIVLQKSTHYICTVIYIYIITLIYYHTSHLSRCIGPSVFSSVHFLLFNIGDWIGRTLPILKWYSRVLQSCAALRTLFIPIF